MKVNCKDCGAEIEFEYEPEDDALKMMRYQPQSKFQKGKKTEKKVRVYLTCENDHTHPYEINLERG